MRFLPNKHTILAFIAGIVMTLAYAPYNIWPISLLSFFVIYRLIQDKSPKQAAKLGFSFGFGWFAAGVSWVHVSIATYGGLPLIASLALMALLCGYLALYPTLAFACTHYVHNRVNKLIPNPCFNWPYVIIASVLFVISEELRATLLTGFGWLAPGYTLTDSPFASLASVIGELGLTLLLVMSAISLAVSKKLKHSVVGIGIISAATLASVCAPYWQAISHNEKSLDVLLVQGNIKQELRWAPENFWPTMSAYQDMTRQHWDVDLVVWPEAAIPEIEVHAVEFLEQLDKAAAFNDTALITGIVDYQRGTRAIYNNLVVLGKQTAESSSGQYHYLHKNRYRKHQLLPIGEFVPFEDWLRPLAPLFDLPMSSFSRGDKKQPNLQANGYSILPAICYEIAFSELVRGNYSAHSDLLFTVSNDAWFGSSHGPHQHMQISRMRALELGLPLIRVTNNGISAVYDPITKTQQTLPQFERTSMVAKVPLISGQTFYAQYGKTPVYLLIAVLLMVLAAFIIVLSRPKKVVITPHTEE
jgi:apolipoprotein N-acyltransferase